MENDTENAKPISRASFGVVLLSLSVDKLSKIVWTTSESPHKISLKTECGQHGDLSTFWMDELRVQ